VKTIADVYFSRILLIKPSALGDVIHTLPVLDKLRKRYPAAKIDWFIRPELADVVRSHPAAPGIVLFPRRELGRFGWDMQATRLIFDLLRQLRQGRYDLVVDLHGQFRSAIFALATGAPVRVGFPAPRAAFRSAFKTHGWRGAREGSWLAYTHHLSLPTLDIHAIDRYLRVGELLGFGEDNPDIQVYLPPEAHRSAAALLKHHALSCYALLAPGTQWETKHWAPARFAQVGRQLIERGFGVVLAGGPGDRERCRQVAAACPGAVDLSGQTTTGELGALIARSAICVTNDSGPMHYAVALGRPVVSIFGPTNPVHIGPYRRPRSVVSERLPCAPCNLRRERDCAYGHACMEAVTPRAVMERIEEVLDETAMSAFADCLRK